MKAKMTFVKMATGKSGTSKNGEWSFGVGVFKTLGQYPKDVALEFWGDQEQELLKLVPGQVYSIGVDVQSREHNEKWYTTAKAWSIEPATASSNAGEDTKGQGHDPSDDDEGLPF